MSTITVRIFFDSSLILFAASVAVTLRLYVPDTGILIDLIVKFTVFPSESAHSFLYRPIPKAAF